MDVSIYGLTDDSGIVEYVGQTRCALKTRLQQHILSASTSSALNKDRWIADILVRGQQVRIVELEETSLDLAANREIAWIHHFGQQGLKLYNTVSTPLEYQKPPIPIRRSIRLSEFLGDAIEANTNLWFLAEKGRLKTFKIGRVYRVLEDDIPEVLEQIRANSSRIKLYR